METSKVIVITPEVMRETSWQEIRAMLSLDIYRLHLRLPKASEDEVRRILERLNDSERSRIVIHDQYNLCGEFSLAGCHRNRRHEGEERLYCSRSCHSIEELRCKDAYEYVFLSPVYDSISKSGYSSRFTREELMRAKETGAIDRRVIALGGITRENASETVGMGFGGVAVLGCAWSGEKADLESVRLLVERLRALC